jgi:tRNA(Arg) A34 adenosine deaminase TadA
VSWNAPVDDEIKFMRRAIALSRTCLASDEGPFGAVVVHEGRIIGEGVNRVIPTGDPTAHAEIVAMREACKTIRSHVLEGAVIYTSCEPCPMCLGAIWWARVSEIVYANNREDAAAIGFDDDAIYREVAAPLNRRGLPIRRLAAGEALEIFKLWRSKPDRALY